VILSDRSIREELEAGRIVIEPLDKDCIQPSSVDLHIDRYFRVFLNHTMGHIDVKKDLEDLTQLVEIGEDDVFMLHPGEFVLGSTAERVALPDDLVARLEGKSSLGRLGLLIHSSLPGSEPVFVLHDGRLEQHPIEEVVRKQLHGYVAAFDPETFEVGYEPITGWYEGPPDKIYEVVLASGRAVRVTAGHNLFTLDWHGDVRKIRTGELVPGSRVAIPHRIPDPPGIEARIDVARLVPESSYARLVCEGPTIAAAFARRGAELRRLLVDAGYKHASYYADRARLPLGIVMADPALAGALGPADRITAKGGRNGVAASIAIDEETAWLLGIYVAEGSRRAGQFTVSNTDPVLLDRIEAALRALGLPIYRTAGVITCCSSVGSMLLGWLGTGDDARNKRIPSIVFGWSAWLMEAFLEGLVDGDGPRDASRTSVWTNSPGLAGDVLLLAERLGRRAGSCRRDRDGRTLYQVYLSESEHKLLTSVPLPGQLLIEAREAAGLDQAAAGREIGYRHPFDLNNIERRTGRDAVRFATLRRIRDAYAPRTDGPAVAKLDRLIDGDLLWDTVVEVRDTGAVETIFDIEVRPGGRHIENFVAGRGGVFVSNTAGFVDAGWDGHLTLELSNVANLPITLYPGMKIGQISFLRMTTPADVPYGSASVGSKYQGQRGPTPSRYYENFRKR